MSQEKEVKTHITQKDNEPVLELKLVTTEKEQEPCMLPCIPIRPKGSKP
jgi:hypothetical protein